MVRSQPPSVAAELSTHTGMDTDFGSSAASRTEQVVRLQAALDATVIDETICCAACVNCELPYRPRNPKQLPLTSGSSVAGELRKPAKMDNRHPFVCQTKMVRIIR